MGTCLALFARRACRRAFRRVRTGCTSRQSAVDYGSVQNSHQYILVHKRAWIWFAVQQYFWGKPLRRILQRGGAERRRHARHAARCGIARERAGRACNTHTGGGRGVACGPACVSVLFYTPWVRRVSSVERRVDRSRVRASSRTHTRRTRRRRPRGLCRSCGRTAQIRIRIIILVKIESQSLKKHL